MTALPRGLEVLSMGWSKKICAWNCLLVSVQRRIMTLLFVSYPKLTETIWLQLTYFKKILWNIDFAISFCISAFSPQIIFFTLFQKFAINFSVIRLFIWVLSFKKMLRWRMQNEIRFFENGLESVESIIQFYSEGL